jgi:hypothetical protein
MPTIVPRPPVVELVEGPNPWAELKNAEFGRHTCYFCHPEAYPPMPEFHTLCSCCSQLIRTPGINNPFNDDMLLCPDCETELGAENS